MEKDFTTENLDAPDNNMKLADQLSKTAKSTKFIYHKLLAKDKNLDAHYRYKWEKELNCEILDKTWNDISIHTKSLTVNTKLQAFQYRINNKAIVTNVQLCCWKKKNTDLCTFCNEHPETLVHLMIDCAHVRETIWNPLRKWLNHYCYIELELNPFVILFNMYKDSFPKLVNTLILITKQYIYASRCLEIPLSFPHLVTKIAEYRNIERIIARKTKTFKKFEAKWDIYDMM